jgi:enoyl-CoA hydratase
MENTLDGSEGSVRCEVRGPLLLMGLDRVAKRNGLTPTMYRQLGKAYSRLDDDPALRVGVVHAFGDHFCAGLDLPSFAPLIQRGEKALDLGDVEPVDAATEGYRRRRKPLVMAVKGITYTAALEMVLAADVVVAADDCRFSQLEVKRGIMPAGGATVRMVQRAGWGAAMLYLLTGREFDSAAALRMNIVQQTVPAGRELAEAIRIAEDIARQAPLTSEAIRANAMKALEEGPIAAFRELVAQQQRLAASDDVKEGVRSFIEKRPAQFSGR